LRLFILPALHLALCIKIQLDPRGDWFLAFLIDFPAGVVAMLLGYVIPVAVLDFAIVGTLWWYYVGYFARFVYRKVKHSDRAQFYVGTD